ncbi:unnamed protein product [Spirodela intermedia]|uniref:Uncharacterized protein n=1 Tax=Spirodela intermedia TaxID=51605 RepID=A0A7I8I9U2_SPIIN|nr:unnamed protein product [Spirodela intermedia]CAA6654486.1 unnamed protein product [Spirodela intermedia]
MGHIGSTELAAYALVFTVVVRFSNGILLEMFSALETLCGQFFGAGQNHMLGIYLQRSWLVLMPFTAALLPLFLFTTPVLRLLGQDEPVSLMAGKISVWCIPAIFSYPFPALNQVITYYTALSLTVHVLLSWFLTAKLGMGVAGVMGSTIIALWIPVVGQLVFVVCGGCPETWNGLSCEAFKDLWGVVKLSFSSGIMLCLELWYNTILVLLTGHMDDAEISIYALSICININGWEMMIALGFLAAMGSPSSSASRPILHWIHLFVIFLFLCGRISYIFSTSSLVAGAVANLSALLAFSILLNSVQPVLSGVAIGAGWQSTVAYVNIACYYLVGIPLGVVLAYVIGLGVKGVWLGMILGIAVQTLVLTYITCRTEWDHQVFAARSRLKRWLVSKPDNEDPPNEEA